MGDEQRRAELADFLKTRRLALQPGGAGLKTSGRRRTPGLRREEVADLAGVSVSWYTWLEQGRPVRASEQALDAIRAALRLDADGQEYLRALGRQEGQAAASPVQEVRPATLRLIEAQDPAPAYVLGPRFDLLAWNAATTAVYGDFGALPPGRRHVLWLLFGESRMRRLIVNWEPNARYVLAAFRARTARYVDEPWYPVLVGELRRASGEFRAWWACHEVGHRPVGHKVLAHPVVGRLMLEQSALAVDDCSGQLVILYTPQDRPDAEKLATLAARRGAYTSPTGP